MKKLITQIIAIIILASMFSIGIADARGRIGSVRYGGYNSHGKGSHYFRGY